MPLPKPRRLGMPYKCTVVESSMNLDFDSIIPDMKDRPGVKQQQEDEPQEESKTDEQPRFNHR